MIQDIFSTLKSLRPVDKPAKLRKKLLPDSKTKAEAIRNAIKYMEQH